MLNSFRRLRLGIKFSLGMMLLIFGVRGTTLYWVFAREKQLILQEVEARARDLTAMLAFAGGPEVVDNNYGSSDFCVQDLTRI